MYRLEHGLIGRSKQKAGTAAAHARYILRPGAAVWFSIHVPADVAPDRDGVSGWLHRVERGERKNGHLLDKVTVAIPRELRGEVRYALMVEFLDRLTLGGRVPHIAAIHAMPFTKDEYQPHAHIAIRDRDFVTGERVLRTTAWGAVATDETVGSTRWMRVVWAECVNEAFGGVGSRKRVDHRSRAERGERTRSLVHMSRGTWNRFAKRRRSAA